MQIQFIFLRDRSLKYDTMIVTRMFVKNNVQYRFINNNIFLGIVTIVEIIMIADCVSAKLYSF